MIKSFKDADTLLLWDTGHLGAGKSRRIPASIRISVLKKLRVLHRVIQLSELKVPPGNRLEALAGNRTGPYSIRVNDQFRICFVWNEGHAYDVEVADYH